MYPSLTGFNVTEATFYTEENITPGMTVMITKNYTATIPANNFRFAGICTGVHGNYISVALSGVVTVPYTGDAPAIGYKFLSGDGAGNIKLNVAAEREYLVLDVNEEEKLITIML